MNVRPATSGVRRINGFGGQATALEEVIPVISEKEGCSDSPARAGIGRLDVITVRSFHSSSPSQELVKQFLDPFGVIF